MKDIKLLTVKVPEWKTEDDIKKNKNKKTDKIKPADIKLKQTVDNIRAKQTADVHYLLSNKERAALITWSRKEEQVRRKEIIKSKKSVSKKNDKMQKRRKVKSIIPRSTQQSIPFYADYEEGLFEVEPNKFSKTYELKDINYMDASDESRVDIFVRYGEFLNYFSEDINIAVTIYIRTVSVNEQEDKILYKLTGDQYDVHREEYNRILKQQIVSGRNNMVKAKYITVTIDADTPYEALLKFHKIDAEVTANLRLIGSDGRLLGTDERLALLHDKFRKGREGEFKIDYNFIKEQGLSSKDYIAPSSMNFEINHFQIEDEYYRCLYLNNLPASLADEFLFDVSESKFPLITTLNIQPVAQNKALRLVRKQLTGMQANQIAAEKKPSALGTAPKLYPTV